MSESVSSPWRTVPEAAARVKLSKQQVYRAIKEKHLRAAVVGGRRQPFDNSVFFEVRGRLGSRQVRLGLMRILCTKTSGRGACEPMLGALPLGILAL